jgi:DNA-binding response OmpR family regulator
MNDLNHKMINFTPNEYRSLTIAEINEMMDKNIPFKVSNVYVLDHGFNYCLGTNSLYKNNECIPLTRLENKLIALLVLNKKEFVDVDTIKKEVWRGKLTSIFTMRNTIKRIRDKTYYGIIKNKSDVGYSIWVKEQ